MFRKVKSLSTLGRVPTKKIVTLITTIFIGHSFASLAEVELNFYDSATVDQTHILLSDIAEVRSEDSALVREIEKIKVGEAAPPGYKRFLSSEDIITFYLQSIFEDARFVTSGHKRVEISTDYREMKVEEFMEHIHSYIASNIAWNKGEWSVTINNPLSSWKAYNEEYEIEFTGLNSPHAKGNTNIIMMITQGSRTYRIPVSCFIRVISPVLIAKEPITRGERISTECFTVDTLDITTFAHTPLRRFSQLEGKQAVRTINEGTIIHDRIVRAAPLIMRGDQVQITFTNSRVRVSVLGIAREEGRAGERIWVQNQNTKRVLRAEVTGRGVVTVFQNGENI
ncbi:flagellar basal body P-ring formation chaperone FlgA [Chitinispirillales bacterium ANBcel5]|uniref:flagellar basal body P-ring formation chaperone FlgA n=1 Tax=Cellulosispirillum alkaliphilum TaxID=3039283 RepID=UPI002A5010FD|nr:flagellar basal body P-ring formation chaperone FlgA [Chitinispirillales bacterium ANBcel5]